MSGKQIPRRVSFAKRNPEMNLRGFNYDLDYSKLDLRRTPELYRVGRSEEGVLLVEPYKSEILPHWKFATPDTASVSAKAITKLFRDYKREQDFVGMDMARKFLQMGYTRSRRYANHRSGRKYDADLKLLPFENDPVKAASAEIFWKAWQATEQDQVYADLKMFWREAFG